VEILSPSNTKLEMLEKVTLFLEAGAKEVWLVNEDGEFSIYDSQGERKKSGFMLDINKISISH